MILTIEKNVLQLIIKLIIILTCQVYLFDNSNDTHPSLAVKDEGWRKDDPKEMVKAFSDAKDNKGQLLRIVKY